jgi:1-acyl-sn-glycerol-3-phosphate acyltransferase
MPTKRTHHPGPFYKLVRAIVHGLLKLLTRLQVRGLENVPPHGPYIVITNHLSMLDAPIIMDVIPATITVFAANTHRRDFFIGELMDRIGAIWVKRGEPDREALRAALNVLKENGVIGLAPEGTRSRTGGLIQGRIGVAYLAAHANVPILPVALVGTEVGLQATLGLKRPRLTATIGPAFRLPDCGGRPTRQDLDAYTQTIMLTLARMLPERYRGVYRDAAAAAGAGE